MTANALIKDASCIGPTAMLTGTTYQANGWGGLRGIVRYATTEAAGGTTAALPSVNVPSNQNDTKPLIPLRGKWLRIHNEDTVAGLDFAFGAGSAPTLVYGQTATFAAGHASAGWRIQPASYIDVVVPLDATHVAFIQASGAVASTVAFYCSEGPV